MTMLKMKDRRLSPRPNAVVVDIHLTTVTDMICVRMSDRVMVLSRTMICTGPVRFPASLVLSCWNEKPDFGRTASPFDDRLSPATK